MRAHGEKLSRKQEQTIAALLTCNSITAAAAGCGIAEATLHRWLKETTFQTAYREARRQIVQQASGTAVQTLEAVMQDTAAPASARVSAAKAVLETAVKAVEVEDLEARLAALEAAATEQP